MSENAGPAEDGQPFTWRELRAWREARDLTQGEAALLVGRSERQWRRWESGNHVIPPYVPSVLESIGRRIDSESKEKTA